MAKESGMGMTIGVDVAAGGALKQIENDITNLTFDIPRAIQDITGVDKSAHERLHLLADIQVTLNGVFNDAVDKSHDVFKSIAGVRTCTIIHSAQTLTAEILIGGYGLSRGAGGELTWSVPLSNADGAVPAWS